MANTNKVEFGLSNVHIAQYSIGEGGVATIGTPEKMPGAVSLTLEEGSELYQFFADDGVYYSDHSESGETGELTMALFPDWFKINYLGYAEMADGGIARIKGEPKKLACLIFEGKGDKQKRRHIMFNCSFGAIGRERKTFEEQKEVEVETVPVSIVGDNNTGVVKISYSESDQGYSTVFSAPTIPARKPGV